MLTIAKVLQMTLVVLLSLVASEVKAQRVNGYPCPSGHWICPGQQGTQLLIPGSLIAVRITGGIEQDSHLLGAICLLGFPKDFFRIGWRVRRIDKDESFDITGYRSPTAQLECKGLDGKVKVGDWIVLMRVK